MIILINTDNPDHVEMASSLSAKTFYAAPILDMRTSVPEAGPLSRPELQSGFQDYLDLSLLAPQVTIRKKGQGDTESEYCTFYLLPAAIARIHAHTKSAESLVVLHDNVIPADPAASSTAYSVWASEIWPDRKVFVVNELMDRIIRAQNQSNLLILFYTQNFPPDADVIQYLAEAHTLQIIDFREHPPAEGWTSEKLSSISTEYYHLPEFISSKGKTHRVKLNCLLSSSNFINRRIVFVVEDNELHAIPDKILEQLFDCIPGHAMLKIGYRDAKITMSLVINSEAEANQKLYKN